MKDAEEELIIEKLLGAHANKFYIIPEDVHTVQVLNFVG